MEFFLGEEISYPVTGEVGNPYRSIDATVTVVAVGDCLKQKTPLRIASFTDFHRFHLYFLEFQVCIYGSHHWLS